MSAKPKTTRKATPKTLSELSRATRITRESLRKWKSEGVDINDPAQLTARIEGMRASTTPGSLTDAKLRKILLECEKIQHALDVEKGKYFEADLVRATTRAMDHFTCLVWKRLGRELAPVLDGLPTSKIEAAVNEHIDHSVIPRFRQLLLDAKLVTTEELEDP